MNAGRACGVCGEACPAPFRVPTAEMAPDLDGRPGEPARSTLRRWIQLCRRCGAAAPDLAALPTHTAVDRTEPNPFLRWAAIAQGQATAEAVLQAAWAEEDAGRDGQALRLRAAAAWQGDALRRADILRRAGDFAAAETVLAAVAQPDEEARAIIVFQRERIAAGDAGRHSLSSALRPPARMPHVAHGKRSGSSSLSRLFGR